MNLPDNPVRSRTGFVDVISSLYIGFGPRFTGGIIGALWGCIDGAIGGAIIAIVYNAMVRNKRNG